MAAMASSMAVPVVGMAAVSLSTGHHSVQKANASLRSSSLTPMLSTRSKPSGLGQQKRSSSRKGQGQSWSLLTVRAASEVEDLGGTAAGAGGDSIVSEVAVLEEEPETPGVSTAVATKERKPGALQRGGTLSGKEALGKDPSKSTALGQKSGGDSAVEAFKDPRWIEGTWDLSGFTKDGKVNWDGVIDAEVKRRKYLEDYPEASTNEEPVVFETSTIPWWAWVRRFHLPEAELLNGRAAMIGYVAAYVVDSLTGVGLVDQQSSFLGKLLLFITIVGVLLIRKNEDLDVLKTLAKESTFYDKQWQASWKEDATKKEKL